MVSSSNLFLSVLIPVYRKDISELVIKLDIQLLKCGFPFEIIVMDDSAEERFFDWHQNFRLGKKLNILTAQTNKGRSGSRNFLMQQAKGSHFLFLDGDMTIDRGFIGVYLEAIKNNPDKVLVGGIRYESDATGLRSRVGSKREQVAASIRQKHPYRAFTAANVVLPAAVGKSVLFDESIVTYGHEDTVFGLCLADKNIPILHIDNPAVHLGLETDESYLLKVEESLQTLAKLWHKNALIQKFADEISLVYVWRRLKWLLQPSMFIWKGCLKNIRLQATKKLLWLDVYKLLFFHAQVRRLKP